MAGTSVTLIGGTFDPQATFHWEKDGQVLPGAGSTTLVLRHLQPGDSGDYQLVAENRQEGPGLPPLGEAATRTARVEVITPALAAGQLDQAFGDAIPAGLDARAVLALPDGGCLVAGQSASGRRLVRLNVAGEADPLFSPVGAASSAGVSSTIRCLAAQGGGFLVGGDFETFAGRAFPRLVRITAEGALDASFAPVSPAVNVRALAVQRIGGEDRILAGLSASPWLRRFRPDGSADASFVTPPLTGRVSAITVQADGRILLGGSFTPSASWPYHLVARLRADGSPDTSGPSAFAPVSGGPAGSAEVLALVEQANGRILLGGSFTAIAGENRFYLARLLGNGALDTLFHPVANDVVSALAVSPDGRILVGGAFSRLEGANLRGVGRLTSGGLTDATWTAAGFDGKVNALALSGPLVYAAGNFGQPHASAVRLLTDPAPAAPVATHPAASLPAFQAHPGRPLLLTVPISSSAETTYAWTRPGFSPVLTTAPKLFFPAASTALAGTWTVTAVNDTGSLTWGPFEVRVSAPSAGLRPVLAVSAASLPLALPTLGTVALSFPAPAMTLEDVRVHLELQHTDVNDLGIELIAPDGQRLSLIRANSTRRGSNFEHTTFADDAPLVINAGAAPFRGSWQPEQEGGFASLRRAHAAGMWRLSIEDTDADASAASVQAALLEFSTPATLPAFTSALPPGRPAIQVRGAGALLRHWNAPPGLSAFTETSVNLSQWLPSAVLAIRQEPDQSQSRTVAVPALPACHFRHNVR